MTTRALYCVLPTYALYSSESLIYERIKTLSGKVQSWNTVFESVHRVHSALELVANACSCPGPLKAKICIELDIDLCTYCRHGVRISITNISISIVYDRVTIKEMNLREKERNRNIGTVIGPFHTITTLRPLQRGGITVQAHILWVLTFRKDAHQEVSVVQLADEQGVAQQNGIAYPTQVVS
eukprot:gene18374-5869_t